MAIATKQGVDNIPLNGGTDQDRMQDYSFTKDKVVLDRSSLEKLMDSMCRVSPKEKVKMLILELNGMLEGYHSEQETREELRQMIAFESLVIEWLGGFEGRKGRVDIGGTPHHEDIMLAHNNDIG